MSEFIPKQYKKEPITIRVSNDKLERIEALAGKHGLSRSEFIIQCIDYAIKGDDNLEREYRNIRNINELGQVILPRTAREALGWAVKTKIEIIADVEKEEIVLRRYEGEETK